MKIGVCTLTIGEEFKKGVALCIKSITDYCERHSYTLINDESIVKLGREPYWNKVLLLEKYLPDYDYLVWIDADMMIMNPSIKLESLIVNYLCDKDMMLATDCGDQINTGCWFVKNSDYSKMILRLIYNLPELCGHFHEQGVLNHIHTKNIADFQTHCLVFPEIESRLINATMSTYHLGDFLIHFLGIRKPTTIFTVSSRYAPFLLENETKEALVSRLQEIKKEYERPNMRYIDSPPRIRIAFCTLLVGEKYTMDTVKYGLRSLEIYCQRRGYDMIVEHGTMDDSLPPHFSKMLLLQKHMDKYDYVIWIDADIMIMNLKILVQDLIVKYMGTHDMMVSRDISGHINTGFWIVRTTEQSRHILGAVHKLPELRYRGCEEQDVFNELYTRDLFGLQSCCKVLDDQSIMNCCVGLFKWEYYLIHFMSLGKDGLKSAFRDYFPDRRDDETQIQFQHRMKYLCSL